MKITGALGPDLPALTPVGDSAAPAPVGSTTSAASSAASSTAAAPQALQSAVLQPALKALRDMPDIDQDKVDAVRDALARGEAPFDAAKLAGLIERFHGSRG